MCLTRWVCHSHYGDGVASFVGLWGRLSRTETAGQRMYLPLAPEAPRESGAVPVIVVV
jgi:hypothetical protein